MSSSQGTKNQRFWCLDLHGVFAIWLFLLLMTWREKTGGDSPEEREMGHYYEQECWMHEALACVVVLVILL